MNNYLNYIIELCQELIDIPSPSGFTEQAMNRVRQEIKALGYDYSCSKNGCTLVHIEGVNKGYTKFVSAHVDTIGAMVKEIKKSGRLELINIGGFVWGSVEGSNVKIHCAEECSFDGTILPLKPSVHLHGDEARTMMRSLENMEIRIDKEVYSEECVKSLGICPGDFISFDPRTVITETGFIKSRFLDDKVCVALILAYMKYLKSNKILPRSPLYLNFSNHEELGHSLAEMPNEVDEFIALDVGITEGYSCEDEKRVSITARDRKTVYDYGLRSGIQKTAKDNGIGYIVGVYNNYSSDASITASQGVDVKFACIGPTIHAAHHYERVHVNSLIETLKLLAAYL